MRHDDVVDIRVECLRLATARAVSTEDILPLAKEYEEFILGLNTEHKEF